MKIGIDLDGVVVDFTSSYLELYNKKYLGKIQREEIFSSELWIPLDISKEEAVAITNEFCDFNGYENLNFLNGAKEGLLSLMRRGKVYFITARSLKARAQTERFLRRNFENSVYEIFYTNDFFENGAKSKKDICDDLGIEIFVEDSKKYAFQCAEGGVRVFLMSQPWNKGFEHKNIIRVNNWGEVLDKIKEIELNEQGVLKNG